MFKVGDVVRYEISGVNENYLYSVVTKIYHDRFFMTDFFEGYPGIRNNIPETVVDNYNYYSRALSSPQGETNGKDI